MFGKTQNNELKTLTRAFLIQYHPWLIKPGQRLRTRPRCFSDELSVSSISIIIFIQECVNHISLMWKNSKLHCIVIMVFVSSCFPTLFDEDCRISNALWYFQFMKGIPHKQDLWFKEAFAWNKVETGFGATFIYMPLFDK